MIKIYLLIFSLIPFTGVMAQATITTDTIQWNITEVHNVNANMYEGAGDRLVLFSSDRIEWKDTLGNVRFQFDISEVQGIWADIDQPGMLTLGFQFEGQPGQAVVKRENNEFIIEIRLYMAETNPQEFILKTNTYSVL